LCQICITKEFSRADAGTELIFIRRNTGSLLVICHTPIAGHGLIGSLPFRSHRHDITIVDYAIGLSSAHIGDQSAVVVNGAQRLLFAISLHMSRAFYASDN